MVYIFLIDVRMFKGSPINCKIPFLVIVCIYTVSITKCCSLYRVGGSRFVLVVANIVSK